MTTVAKAAYFSRFAHCGQFRKYTGEPYFNHCEAVARIVQLYGGTNAMVMAAYLHDTVEDTDVTNADIQHWFGQEVAFYVHWLTDVSKPHDGNRKIRKALDRFHSADAPENAQFIKCADIINNTQDICEHDKDFARVYLREMHELLKVMTKVHETAIYNDAVKIVQYSSDEIWK